MTTKQNGKLSPFQIGDKVHHISTDTKVRIVLWTSKRASSRGEQLIVTDYDTNPVEADIYVEAR